MKESKAVRLERALRQYEENFDILIHDCTDESTSLVEAAKLVYREHRKNGFEQAGIKARIFMIEQIYGVSDEDGTPHSS